MITRDALRRCPRHDAGVPGATRSRPDDQCPAVRHRRTNRRRWGSSGFRRTRSSVRSSPTRRNRDPLPACFAAHFRQSRIHPAGSTTIGSVGLGDSFAPHSVGRPERRRRRSDRCGRQHLRAVRSGLAVERFDQRGLHHRTAGDVPTKRLQHRAFGSTIRAHISVMNTCSRNAAIQRENLSVTIGGDVRGASRAAMLRSD